MSIVNRLTLRHLKENKGRTVITTLGICVSVAMITAVFVAVASFLNLFGEIELMGSGHKHALLEVNQHQLTQLSNDERMDRVGVRVSLDSNSYYLENAKSKSSGTGDIYCGDYTNLQQMFTGRYEGTIPKNESEIAVEQRFIEKNKLDWKIGDTVTLPTGYRYIHDEKIGQVVVNGDYQGNSERFQIKDIGKYKITAILYNNPATMTQYNIIRGFDLSGLNLTDGQTVTASIELKEVNYKSLDVIRDIIKQYKITDYDINSNYLETKFAIDQNSALAVSILPMASVVLVIILIASVVLIYNAFGMSLSERIRYLGMLASVGATKIQKKMSVYYEGFILGAVGIPVGILAGIAGIGITLKAVGKKIIATGMIMGVSDSGMNMDVVVPLWAVIGIIIFSVFTIFISAFIPSRKASKITPIDAIRQRSEIKIKAKSLKSPKPVRAIFGYEGELAYKNLKRNGRKSRVIIASIALSVVLFLSVNYFCQSFVQAIHFEMVPYQVQAMISYDDRDKFISQLDNISDIDDYYCVANAYFCLNKNDEPSLSNSDFLTNSYRNLFDSKVNMFVNYIDDDDFNQLCRDNGIDYQKYYGDTLKGILMNNMDHHDNTLKVYNEKLLGEKICDDIEITDFVKYDKDNYICNLNAQNCVSVYLPVSNHYSHLSKEDQKPLYIIGIETEQHEKVTERIQDVFDEKDYETRYVSDFVETFQAMNTLVFVLEVFVYGFIALITLITIANIINTISTGIAMRKKEFAMLKSVGTSPKGFRKMVSLESAFYGIKALIFAIPLSILISFGMNRLLANSTIVFKLNYALYAAVILAVFVIVGLSMLYAVSKLKDDSVVETLKEEIN